MQDTQIMTVKTSPKVKRDETYRPIELRREPGYDGLGRSW
jgi:hypothetical protein